MGNAPLHIKKNRFGSPEFVTLPELGDKTQYHHVEIGSKPHRDERKDVWMVAKKRSTGSVICLDPQDDIQWGLYEWVIELDLESISGEAEVQRNEGKLKNVYIEKW